MDDAANWWLTNSSISCTDWCICDAHGLLVRAFITHVRPLLEYASCVWSPYLLKHIQQIESVQRRFTKRLPGLFNVSYKQYISKSASLETLELRRLHQDLLYTYKIIFRRVDIEVDTIKYTVYPVYLIPCLTSVPMLPLEVINGNYLQHLTEWMCANIFFANRVIAPWNSLNLFEDNVKSVATFKRLSLESDLSCYCILNLDWLFKVN